MLESSSRSIWSAYGCQTTGSTRDSSLISFCSFWCCFGWLRSLGLSGQKRFGLRLQFLSLRSTLQLNVALCVVLLRVRMLKAIWRAYVLRFCSGFCEILNLVWCFFWYHILLWLKILKKGIQIHFGGPFLRCHPFLSFKSNRFNGTIAAAIHPTQSWNHQCRRLSEHPGNP